MAGLAMEINEMIEYTEDGSATREMGIILVSQKIKQVEIATYSGLMKLAAILGREDVADSLLEILNDETEFNELLLNQGEIISLLAVQET
jgi:ferritin-like metal-binding protein YciE